MYYDDYRVDATGAVYEDAGDYFKFIGCLNGRTLEQFFDDLYSQGVDVNHKYDRDCY